ncbi:glycoside hydrolase family 35 protein [Telmatobacter bradus]|uniref:glycoside hydrolase family 35 protein n=1 Tax=Telmatobacter bradus TaxID=474953 RepID=UPI003B43D637
MSALRRLLLPAALGLACLALGTPAAHAHTKQPEKPSFTVNGDHLELNGKPFQIVSGEMHYERIPREYWRARLRMARAMGLNTIATYVFWNVHEPEPGKFDFSGNADLAEFLREAQQEGLYMMLRVGPYSCAEWEFGGFPAWLLQDPKNGLTLRSNDPAFTEPAEKWLKRLAQEVGPLQIGRGGPVIAAQIENEYGNFGSDAAYMEHLRQIFLKVGFNDCLLYTANPSRTIAKGSIPGVFAAVNFGIGHADVGLNALAQLRPGAPLFAAEYWPGWFDHWGEPHQTRTTDPQIADLGYILGHKSGVNIYMFHGGTSFGKMAGSSWIENKFRPDVTSYDYDAPLDEAGRPTAKYFAYRTAIAKATGVEPPPVPPAPPSMAVPAFTLTESSSLWVGLPAPVQSNTPKRMEELGQSYGFILYRKTLDEPAHADLVLSDLNDYALVYLDGRLLGALDRSNQQDRLRIDSDKPGARLDILVENSGRINSTREIRKESKGISAATLADKPLTGWAIYCLPMKPDSIFDAPGLPAEANFTATAKSTTAAKSAMAPAFYRGAFTLDLPANKPIPDTFLDAADLGKGEVWLNGHPLGRIWNVGPQRTLYVPGVWLHTGRNEVVVLDLLRRDHAPHLAGLAQPVLDAPTRQSTAAPDENVGASGKP